MADVIVAAYPEPMVAHLARIRLEAEGIESWIDDENTAAVYPLYASLIGGVKLRVHEEDVERALQIVRGIDADTKGDYEEGLQQCPECGSDKVGKNTMSFAWLVILSLITAGLYLPLFYRNRECGHCGYRW